MALGPANPKGRRFKPLANALHFGLDDAPQTDLIHVRWANGPSHILQNYPAQETWTLYPPERLGDADGDGVVAYDDYLVMTDCFGAGVEPGCEMMDLNGDAVIDYLDAAEFFAVYDDPQFDCNGNGTGDLEDILTGTSPDENGNGVPDECDGGSADVNGDGAVNVQDFVLVLLSWGPCAPVPQACRTDVTGDGVVDVEDLVAVLLNWG